LAREATMSKFTKETYSSVRGNGETWLRVKNSDEFDIQPGDGTRYTLVTTTRHVLFYVGDRLDDSRNPMLVILERDNGYGEYYPVYTSPSARDYETDVATFFSNLLLGLEVEEPEVLAFRRPKDNNHE
jgi:hypothetical protein